MSGSAFSIEPMALELSEAQKLALRALVAFGSVVGGGVLATRTPVAGAALAAAVAVVATTLPQCPHGPPGRDIGTTFDANNNIVLSCAHTSAEGGPHCWSIGGQVQVC